MRSEEAAGAFAAIFGAAPEVRAEAPGRVNLIGEHTDYHHGYVLPTVIPQRTRVELRRRDDERVRARSAYAGPAIDEYVLGSEARAGRWLDYVQGVTAGLAAEGARLTGFDAYITSDVPAGAGVSSSAALEVALLRALRQAFGLDFDDVALARRAQRVETEFVGAPVGIMDQMASSLGRDGEALFLDTRSLEWRAIPLPAAAALIVIDSGVSHRHADGDYARRREESFAAARALGVEYLRDLTPAALPRIDALPPLLARRARHVVTENARVLHTVTALLAGDLGAVGRLFAASQASMRDDYETSTPEIDLLAALGDDDPDVYGARLTGGGFGGSVVMLADAAAATAAAARICDTYRAATGRQAAVLVPAAAPTDAPR